MYCEKLFESLQKRLQERKTLRIIGEELCPEVEDHRAKVLRMLDIYMGEAAADQYLLENADWLEY